jgi:hypothetical protein
MSDWQQQVSHLGDSYGELLGVSALGEGGDAADLIEQLDAGLAEVKTFHGVNRFPPRSKPHQLASIDTDAYLEMSQLGLTEENYQEMNEFNVEMDRIIRAGHDNREALRLRATYLLGLVQPVPESESMYLGEMLGELQDLQVRT